MSINNRELRILVRDGLEPEQDITDQTKNLIIRCASHGGVYSIEFDVGDDYPGAYSRARDYIGQKIFVADNTGLPVVAEGKVLECGVSEDGNHVTAYGPWLSAMFSQHYIDTATWWSTGTTSAQIEDMISTECPDVYTHGASFPYILETNTNNYPWQPTQMQYPGDLIPGLAALSDAGEQTWHFWLSPNPEMFTLPPIPYFQPEGASLIPRYTIRRGNMSRGGLNLMHTIRDLANDVRVNYRDSAGSPQQTASATNADSQSLYGVREKWSYDLGRSRGTAAAQYRNLLLDTAKEYQLTASFRSNSWLYDEYGTRYPLWRGIADFPFRLTVEDIVPDEEALTWNIDHTQTFMVVAAEYSHANRTLQMVPDTQDRRAAAILARHRGMA